MKTEWQGLWSQGHPGAFAGKVINKADIPDYTRIVLKYNKYYEKGSKRPRFIYCFMDAEDYKDTCVSVSVDERQAQKDAEDAYELAELAELHEKIEELAELMRRGNANGDLSALPSESQAIAQDLMSRAIGIVEEITGEKWEFSYITF